MTDRLLAAILDNSAMTMPPTDTARVCQFTIKKFVLKNLLEKAITVVPTRDVMPVLKCFQFHVEHHRLQIVASDMEMTLIAATDMVSTVWPGTVVFPARRLLDIVKASDDHDVNINVKNTSASITIGRACWALQLQPGHDYPALPQVTDAAFISTDRKTFTDAITAVRYAASRDPSRANLNIIDITDGKLTACDGSRIQQIRNPDLTVSLRIPISAVDDLLRLLKHTDADTLRIGQSDTKLIFTFGNDIFIVSKYFAQFPDMESTLLRPAMDNRHHLDADRNELLSAIRRVRINADDASSALAIHLEPGTATIIARDKHGNRATEPLDVVYEGPERTIAVNHKYLTDMIDAHHHNTCSFRLGDDTKTRRTPLLLRDPDTGNCAVVQQMMIDWTTA